MDKAITIKRINQGWDSFVLKDNKLEPYTLNSGEISKAFNIQKLMNDNQYFEEVYNQGYKWHRKVFWTKDHNLHHFYIPVTRKFVEYYSLNWDTGFYKESIVLSNRDLNDKVESFYEFSLEVEVAGFRSDFGISNAYPKTIYLNMPWKDEERIKRMTAVLGEPRTVPENETDKFGRFSKDYIVPMERIDKVIGIKRYRDTSSFGQIGGEQYTGEVEEFVLDLHHFDEKVYNILKEHHMLEVER